MGQYVGERRRYARTNSSQLDDASLAEAAVREFEGCWASGEGRLEVIGGKGSDSEIESKPARQIRDQFDARSNRSRNEAR